MTEKRKDAMEGVHAHPQWLQQKLAWFQDLKFGLFVHWGPYSQWGCIESWPLVEEDTWARPDDLKPWIERDRDFARFQRDYWSLNRTFNPMQFDPAVWADAAGYAGMKYVTFTTKHHDGFCMFDTETTDYRATHPDCPFHTDPRANIAAQVFDTFRSRDFGISCYFSKSDWHCPYYWRPDAPAPHRRPNYDTRARPDLWAKFVDFVHRQVEELMSGYGRIDALWLDGGQVRPPDLDIRMDRLAAMARSHQPGLIVADRTVGGAYENILTPEQRIPDEPLDAVWESCLTMGTGWSYRQDDEYKPARTLIHMLVDIAAKGGNFLLNVGPAPDGTFPPEALDRLKQIGDWMSVNAEAIHGTRAIAPYKAGNICYTAKGDRIYAIVLAGKGEIRPPTKVTLAGLCPAPGADIRLLGCEKPIDFQVLDGSVEVVMPVEDLPCEHAWVLTFRVPG